MSRLHRPLPVEGVIATQKPRSFLYDPTITVAQDIPDHTGRVIHAQGTRIHPLHIRSLSHPLVFIDGDDVHQTAWSRRQCQNDPQAKIILVKGNPFTLMETLNRPVFFDQGGVLVRKLGIRQVPARVTQQGDHLVITEEKADA